MHAAAFGIKLEKKIAYPTLGACGYQGRTVPLLSV